MRVAVRCDLGPQTAVVATVRVVVAIGIAVSCTHVSVPYKMMICTLGPRRNIYTLTYIDIAWWLHGSSTDIFKVNTPPTPVARHSHYTASPIAPVVHGLGFAVPVLEREASEPRSGSHTATHAPRRASRLCGCVRLRAALAAAAACAQRARDPSELCSHGRSHSIHIPEAMGGVSWGLRAQRTSMRKVSTRPPTTMPSSSTPLGRPPRTPYK